MPAKYAQASNKVFHSRILPLDTPAVKTTTTNDFSEVPNEQRLTKEFAPGAMSNRAAQNLNFF
jgi:hypothetical protein